MDASAAVFQLTHGASVFRLIYSGFSGDLVWTGNQKSGKQQSFSDLAAVMWTRCQSVLFGLGLIHLNRLALVHRFTLVGKSLMSAELSGLCEAAVATLAPVTHTHTQTHMQKENTHKTKISKGQWLV